MARKLEVTIVGDAKSLERAFASAGRSATTFQKRMQTVSRSTAIAAAAIGGAVAVAAKAGFDELAESQKVGAQTAAVLKSTGAAAGITQRAVESLAGSLSKMSGVDDEAIQSAENLLLTFTNVGKNAFGPATRAALDMSVALGQDLKSSALQVGKALNDPIKGVTALQRVGVSFTSAQRDQIAALVKTGRTLDAQKLILAELSKEFGGSAKAFGETLPGQLAKTRNAVDEAAASFTQAFLPAIQKTATAVESLSGFLTRHTTTAKALIVTAGALAIALGTVSIATKTYASALAIARAAQIALNFALTANPIGVVVVALAALATGLVIAYQRSETFRRIVNAAFKGAADAVADFLRVFTFTLDKFLGGLSTLGHAVSFLPGFGDDFSRAADKIDAAREKLRGLIDGIDSLGEKKVDVQVNINAALKVTGDAKTFGIDPISRPTPGLLAGVLKTFGLIDKQFAAAETQVESMKTKAENLKTQADRLQAARDRFAEVFARLELRGDRAARTRTLRDDLAVARAQLAAVKAEIRIEGNTLELARQRLDIEGRILDLEAERKRRRQASLQAAQFRALGLGPTGDKPPPTIANLKKQLAQISESILGTSADSSRNRALLERIRKVLTDPLRKATAETRRVIQQMFETIRGEFDKGVRSGPLTKASGLNTKKFLAGITGLSDDQVRELRARLSSLNTAGVQLGGAGTSSSGGSFAGGPPIVVESTTNLIVDGERIARVITRNQQKNARRNPRQKRGPNRVGGV